MRARRTLSLAGALSVCWQASCVSLAGSSKPLSALLRVESTDIGVQLRGDTYVAKIGFLFINNTGKPISRAGCDGPGWPSVEKNVNGRWVPAYYPVYLACRRIPDFSWEDGAQIRDTVLFAPSEPGHHIEPELRVDSIDGLYRLHWGFTEGREAGAKGARTVEAISNEFHMTLLRPTSDLNEPTRCDSVPETQLSPDQSLEGLEGRYRLVLVKTQGIRKRNGTIIGLMYLWRTSPRDSSVTGARPMRGDSARSLYFGTTDIDLDAAEANPEFRWPTPKNPDRGSVDPIHPPILGIAHRGADQGRQWLWFALPMGTLGNYRDGRGGLDGIGAGLFVTRVGPSGLFGNWGPFGIVKTGTGYFCAYRLSS